MAGSSLLVLLDDIAAVLDDVAAMTKVAARKTAGVLGDDLAVNAEKVTGVRAERELPVVWAVAKGSFRNKLILVPAALAVSFVAPWLITPVLMLGGLYLCFEGFEKVAHSLLHSQEETQAQQELIKHLSEEDFDVLAYEQAKISGAIRTDFILSLEIIVITLGIVASASFATQVSVVASIAVLMTVGVYGLVAGIVKLDDAGLHLCTNPGSGVLAGIKTGIGRALLAFAPWLMKALGFVGTVAMFMVGGGILVHSIHSIEEWIGLATSQLAGFATVGQLLAAVAPTLGALIVGVIAGALTLAAVTLYKKLQGKVAH